MRFDKAIPVLAFLVTASVSGAAFADQDMHYSLVSFETGAGAVSADVDGTQGIVVEVGKSAEFHIKYQIGMFEVPSGGGTMTQQSSDIKDPEYALLWDQPTQNPSDYPPGLLFSGVTGLVFGTPTQPGTWAYRPAVRDKQDGESPYHSDGFWFTQFANWSGKTWSESKDVKVVVVLAPLSAKALKLECSAGANLTLSIQVDPDSGIVRVIGNDGNIAGVYHANITDDYIAWGKTILSKPQLNVSSFRIDRGTGNFSTTSDFPNPPNGSCQKHATEHKF